MQSVWLHFDFLRKQKSGSELRINGKEIGSSYHSIKAVDVEITCCFCGTEFDDIETLQNHTLQNHQVCIFSNGVKNTKVSELNTSFLIYQINNCLRSLVS